MISVVIPALNESATVRDVIEFARSDARVTEVIVVDDGSIDCTSEIADACGAKAILSTLLGKGASMQDGLQHSSNEVLLYLDGDLSGLEPDLVARMTSPILEQNADFVKARFSRSAGRVTVLTARPLLQTFFPELSWFEQPLGGIVAARRSLLQRLTFENDYGVDVGLLIDAAQIGARLAQADIGHLLHDSQPLEVLGDMATQVSRAILDRAGKYGRLRKSQIEEVREVERRSKAEMCTVLATAEKAKGLALFDMDGVLLNGRFIEELAKLIGKTEQVAPLLDHPTMPGAERSRLIAGLLAGVPRELFEHAARHMPLMPRAAETVVGLRKAGYRVGIVSDSYFLATETVRRRVFADFSIANVMRFRGGKATGHLAVSPAMIHDHGCPLHPICKQNVLQHLVDRLNIDPTNVIAVGNGENDICMLRTAGKSFAFRAPLVVQMAAAVTIEGSLDQILSHCHLRPAPDEFVVPAGI